MTGRPLLLALLAASTGCATSRAAVISGLPEAVARVEELRPKTFDRQHAELLLRIAVDNPGPDLYLTGSEYEIFAEGRAFAAGACLLQGELKGQAHTDVDLSIQLAFLDLPRTARSQFSVGGKVVVVARGVLKALRGPVAVTVPFDGEAEVEATSEMPPD